MKLEKPPSDDILFLLPAHMFGFHMIGKRWVDLTMDSISLVHWNDEAFNSIAIADGDKHLVKDLVSTKISGEKRTDVIESKDNGLVILLHWKTITAEGVPEIARKPLYKVTCGDVGTDAEKVEDIWDCIVLLDEADVFLGQCSFANLQCNALVAVFVRVLEYYQRILILTSNRVEKLGENVDFDDILPQIPKSALYPMNGRQISNAISTARQLALFEERKMGIKGLEHVIRVAQKFDTYLLGVKDNVEDDEWAREEGSMRALPIMVPISVLS
ncbi:hypothetical protein K469DRAFT_729430 [Zopfia rhizophila CBS 207.26]|uniref:ATPase AAA-type core domain-containing protein n=1 Tax=Zopfia rhizophila CBS 207.26 TaxID=1314779 RepID=A0A6A6DTR4_9PEZI|nr:hypothetical protein K469DRAFT_729430 [Zopfia rhizophila CBS 207.26]